MKATMQFRWFVQRNPMPTAAEVREYRDTTNVSLMEAKRILLGEHNPVLQQWWQVECTRRHLTVGGEWRSVPTECGTLERGVGQEF